MNPERAVPVEMTNMCMITKGDFVLVEKRTDPNWPGIVFPGGHVEDVETITDSVTREVMEETGLAIKNLHLVGFQDWWHEGEGRYLVFFYRAEYAGGEMVSSEEGELFWIPLNELPQCDFAEGFETILRVFMDETINELYNDGQTGEINYR